MLSFLVSLGPGQVYSAHQKEVVGSGMTLALQIYEGINLHHNIDVSPLANIGAALPNLSPFTVTSNKILHLISFYNKIFLTTWL